MSYKYTQTEVKPTPKGGMESFYRYIGKNYKLPLMPQGTKGKIYVSFVVDKEGKVKEPRIIKDIGYGTGEEALRILTNYDGFNPGEQRGQKMKCLYSLLITIQSAN